MTLVSHFSLKALTAQVCEIDCPFQALWEKWYTFMVYFSRNSSLNLSIIHCSYYSVLCSYAILSTNISKRSLQTICGLTEPLSNKWIPILLFLLTVVKYRIENVGPPLGGNFICNVEILSVLPEHRFKILTCYPYIYCPLSFVIRARSF